MQAQRVENVYKKLADIFIPYDTDEKKEKRTLYPLFASFLIFWIVVIYLSSKVHVTIDEDTIEIEKMPERFAQIIVPEFVEEKKQEAAKKEEKKETKQVAEETSKVEQKQTGGEEQQQMTAQQKKEIIREKVRTTGVLALLTARGEGGSPIAEILGGGVAQNLDEILGGISGVRAAGSGEELKPLELGAGGIKRRETDIGELAAKGGKEVELGEKKVAAVQSKIATEAPEIEGQMDEETVRKIALKNQSSLKYCFQKAQMRNPELSGKIVVRLTIDADGNVSDISVEQSTIDDQEMVSCVLRMVKRWKFPATGGEVNITFPLVFMSVS
ncbi:MAG: TonB family protein [bacterium]|nr:TonB family protein [bacterium]